jgi:CreA protein
MLPDPTEDDKAIIVKLLRETIERLLPAVATGQVAWAATWQSSGLVRCQSTRVSRAIMRVGALVVVNRRTAVRILRGIVLLFVVLALKATPAQSDDLACLSTTFRFLGANDKVCVSAFDDPKVPGVACHISQARTGGVKGSLGLAEDPSRFSIACRQVGPITVDIAKLPAEEAAYSERTSVFFKHTQVFRIVDKRRNTLVYIALSDKIVEGSPQNSISTVPIMPWGH